MSTRSKSEIGEQCDAAAHLFNSGNYIEAFDAYKILADQGISVCESFVGWMYLSGTGIEKNYELADKYLLKAAIKNDVQALFYLGKLSLSKKDFNTAINWFEKAVAYDYSPALYRLGLMYFRKKYGLIDNDLAFKFFKKAAELGHIGGKGGYARMLVAGHRGFLGRIKGCICFLKGLFDGFKLGLTDYRSEKLRD